jgi:predicted phosphodiesterase
MTRYFAIGDIHGEYDKMMNLINFLYKEAKLDLTVDVLVQLGDRNDRGKDTYKVNEWWKTHQIMYPKNIVVLNGNHDYMLLDACTNRSDLMWFNGGNKTEQSYSKVTNIYGKNGFGNSVNKAGHYNWLKNLPFYYETDDYFFSHAPICKEVYNRSHLPLKADKQRLTWEYVDGVPESEWIEPNAVLKDFGNDYKITVHGHIHGIYKDKNLGYVIPGVRKYGNSVLIDTGAGCVDDGYISCVELSTMTIYNSKQESFKL